MAERRGRRLNGSIRERPEGSGHWQLRVYDGRIRRSRTKTVRASSARQAERLLGEFQREIQAEGPHFDRTMTFRELLDRYVARNQAGWSPSTISRTRITIDWYLRPLHAIPIARLDRVTLELYYRDLADHGGRCRCPNSEDEGHRSPDLCRFGASITQDVNGSQSA